MAMTPNQIFSVTSPKDKVGGPYAIVIKNDKEEWAIVALDWDGTPTLGMRWFNSDLGFPSTFGNSTWIIIPEELHRGLLTSVSLKTAVHVQDFLSGKITGDELKELVL